MQSFGLKLGTEGAIKKLNGCQATALIPQSREAATSYLSRLSSLVFRLICPNILL